MELVSNRDTFDLQKKTKVEFKNLHGVAKKLKEKLVCAVVIGYDTQDASEAELNKLREVKDASASTEGNTTSDANINESVVDFNVL